MRLNVTLAAVVFLLAWTTGTRASPAATELEIKPCRLSGVSAPARCGILHALLNPAAGDPAASAFRCPARNIR
jgi:hypothetical protein